MKLFRSPNALVFSLVLIIAALIRVYTLFKYTLFVWDGSVYVGMGKWFITGGEAGLFEIFRPILFPLIEGAVWAIGFDPMIAGGIIAVISSLGLMALVYKMGERSQLYAGLFAAVILGFTPAFLVYGHIPMTDILSTFMVVWGLYMALKGRLFLAGMLIGLAFLTRFSQGLGAIVLGLSIFAFHYREYGFKNLNVFIWNALYAVLGFAIVAIPYFIWSANTFGDALIQLKEGKEIIGSSMHIYGRGNWFYFTALTHNNKLFYLTGAGVLYILYKLIRSKKLPTPIAVSFIGFAVYLSYFSFEPHKELRYGIPLLPFAALIAGYFISKLILVARIKKLGAYAGVLIIAIALFIPYEKIMDPGISESRTRYYSYFDGMSNATLMATEPMHVARSNIRLIEGLYDNWPSARKVYTSQQSNTQYVALDACVLESACIVDASCKDGKEEFLNELDRNGDKVFSEMDGACELRIYRMSN